jgi:hypothetical protein
MDWLKFGVVALVVAAGLGAWMMRNSSDSADSESTLAQTKKRMDELQPAFKSAREMLVRGEASGAAQALEKLEQQADVPQPLLSWVTLHTGLAQLLAGNELESRKTFARMAARPMFGSQADDRKLSQYFIDLGKQLASDQPIPASIAKEIDKTNYESIGLLLYALKDWDLGQFDEATSLFREFQNVLPQAPYQRVTDYKDLAGPYLSDIELVQTLADRAKAADDAVKRRELLQSLSSAKNELKVKGGIVERLNAIAKDLEEAIAADESKQHEKNAGDEASDAQHLREANKKCSALVAQYRFTEARRVAEDVQVASEKYRIEQRALLAHMTALAKFKTRLIRDMSGAGYNGQIVRRSGAAVPAGRVTATDANVELRSAFGNIPIPWSDVSPDSVIAAAKSFIKTDLPAESAADRNWELGIYALTMGRKELARDLITLAAQAKSEYADIKQVLESTMPGGI